MEFTETQIQKGIDSIRIKIIQVLHEFQAKHRDDFGSKCLPVLYGSVVREYIHTRHACIPKLIPKESDLDIFIPRSEVGVNVRDAFQAYLCAETEVFFKVKSLYGWTSQYTNSHVTRLVLDERHPLLKGNGIWLAVDIVLQKDIMYPDFTCNQLCINPLGKLSILNLSCIHSWETSEQLEAFLHPSFEWFQNCSVFPLETRLDVVSILEFQIQKRMAHVLLYNPRKWFDLFQLESSLQYLDYVRRICINRSSRLLRAGWKIHGIMHGMMMTFGTVCLKCANCEEYNLPKSYAIFLGSRRKRKVKHNWVLRLDGEETRNMKEGSPFPYEIFSTRVYNSDNESSDNSDEELSDNSHEKTSEKESSGNEPSSNESSNNSDNQSRDISRETKQQSIPKQATSDKESSNTSRETTQQSTHEQATSDNTQSRRKLQIKNYTLLVTCGNCGHTGPFCRSFI